MENIYAITGATGNTGHRITEKLLSNGKRVIAIARHEDKLKALAEKGAKPMAGNLMDKDFLQHAFKEANAVYAMIPPDYWEQDFPAYQHKVINALTNAIQANNVKYVVLLSSIGCHLKSGTGALEGLHDFEESMKSLKNINLLILRPSYYMENFYNSIDMIKNTGILGSATKGDIPMPMVCTKDIAEVAARHLLNLDFKGVNVEYILGPRDLTMNEAAQILGRAIGKNDLKYMQFSYEDAKNGMMQAGLPESASTGLVEMSRAFNSGKALEDHKRTAENTTPTSLEEFAKTFAEVYNSRK